MTIYWIGGFGFASGRVFAQAAEQACFLAALSSSRSLVIGRLVGLSVLDLCEKVTFRVSNGN